MEKGYTSIFDKIDIIESVGPKFDSIEDITSDSRQVKEGHLFVAIPGTLVDGHRFIQSAIKSGAKCIVCETLPQEIDNEICYVKVNKADHALGQIASNFYNDPSSRLKLVGVTGTNGKTTIATLLFELFTGLGHSVGLLSTIENKIKDRIIPSTHTTPDPVQLNRLLAEMVEEGVTHCFMEVSSHAIAQGRVAGLSFDGGIFTNLTHDHLDYHQTFKAYRDAKKAFFDRLPKEAFALTNLDDKNGMIMLQNCNAKKFTYSTREFADFKAKTLEKHFDGMLLEINGQEIWTNFVGLFNTSNLLSIFGAAKLLGVSPDTALQQISLLKPVSGRFEGFRSKENVFAIVDYAHTPDALKNVLKSIGEIRTGNEQVITVVGAGGDRDRTKRPVMAMEAATSSEKVILTSDNPRTEDPKAIIDEMREGVPAHLTNRVLSITDRREAIRTACMLAQPGDIVLVAGKGHEDYQEINGVKHHFDDREIIREELNIK